MASLPFHWDKDNKTKYIHIQLLKGSFDAREAIDILNQMVQVKIKFHEKKITSHCSEEEIKMRERRIKQLQDEWKELRATIADKNGIITLNAAVEVE